MDVIFFLNDDNNFIHTCFLRRDEMRLCSVKKISIQYIVVDKRFFLYIYFLNKLITTIMSKRNIADEHKDRGKVKFLEMYKKKRLESSKLMS